MAKEAETSVIGCILMENSFTADAVNDLSPEMFENETTRRVFEVIAGLYWSGKPVDAVTVMAELPEDFKTALYYMANMVPALSHFQDYVRIVQNGWMEREMRDELVKLDMEYLSAEEYIQRVEAMTEKYKATIQLRDDNGISSFSEAAKEFLSWLHAQHKDTPKSGFSKLDTAMGGFMEGSVFVLAARSGCGKTDFAINLAMRMATSGHRVLYFSMEMTNVQLMQRVASKLFNINGERVRDRRLTPEETAKVDRIMDEFQQSSRFSFVQEPNIGVGTVRRDVELWKPDVVIIDHIGLMERSKAKDQYRALGEISNRLKQMALKYKISIIELVQMNRQIENRGSKTPNLSDLRESGDLEQDADYVGFLVPEDTGGKRLVGNDSASVTLHLQKNRHGSTGVFRYLWRPQYHSFSEVEDRYG